MQRFARGAQRQQLNTKQAAYGIAEKYGGINQGTINQSMKQAEAQAKSGVVIARGGVGAANKAVETASSVADIMASGASAAQASAEQALAFALAERTQAEERAMAEIQLDLQKMQAKQSWAELQAQMEHDKEMAEIAFENQKKLDAIAFRREQALSGMDAPTRQAWESLFAEMPDTVNAIQKKLYRDYEAQVDLLMNDPTSPMTEERARKIALSQITSAADPLKYGEQGTPEYQLAQMIINEFDGSKMSNDERADYIWRLTERLYSKEKWFKKSNPKKMKALITDSVEEWVDEYGAEAKGKDSAKEPEEKITDAEALVKWAQEHPGFKWSDLLAFVDPAAIDELFGTAGGSASVDSTIAFFRNEAVAKRIKEGTMTVDDVVSIIKSFLPEGQVERWEWAQSTALKAILEMYPELAA
jgi:hypothetical protein